MQATQNSELFSDLSAEESATINGGHYRSYGYGHGRRVRYGRRVSYHYRSYHYNSRPVRYGYGYNNCY